MVIIPRNPENILLRIERLWNGEPCPDDRLWAQIQVSQTKDGLLVEASGPMLHEQNIPDAPTGARVDELWNFDVVELFLVGPGHQYLELELGAGGHYLLLGFDSIRHRANGYETLNLPVRFEKTGEKTWHSVVVIPQRFVPENLRTLNTFAIMAGQFLAYSPVPGEKPDFHQPDSFPAASL